MQDFEILLEGSAKAHGHFCPGQVIGVRMAMLGCDLIGLDDPSSHNQIKKIIVYVEIDRCAADAIAYVTGVKLGRRSLKFMDYGIMAATFVNLETKKAVRIISREEPRHVAYKYAPTIENKHQQQFEAYKVMPLDLLFDVEEVEVDVPPWDMPGPTKFKAICENCGIVVRDKKEVIKDGKILCKACAYGAYYTRKNGNKNGKLHIKDKTINRVSTCGHNHSQEISLPTSSGITGHSLCNTHCVPARASSPANEIDLFNNPFKKIDVREAVGMPLAHDITEIIPGVKKGPSFKRGHKIREIDVCHLMRLGKNHLYVLDLGKDDVHEDEAVLELAKSLAGPGVVFNENPSEGKIQLVAEEEGLLKVKTDALIRFNLIQEVMCASLHNNVPVKKGQKIAGTRAIPLVIHKDILKKAVSIAQEEYPIFSVLPFRHLRARLIITGNEVYEGLIEDRFEAIVDRKLKEYGSLLVETTILPDNEYLIADKVAEFSKKDTDIIITTGGMSVDPDDVTRIAIKKAGADPLYYGSAVLPGAMFLLAYIKDLPVVGIPACGLYHKTTIFDLILPRLLAGERPNNRDLAQFAVGGMCQDCPTCRYPSCAFGKAF